MKPLSVSFAAASLAILLSGCGTGITSISGGASPFTSSITTSFKGLNGNWLLTGSVPFKGVPGTNTGNTLSFTASFSVSSSGTIDAWHYENIPCGNNGSSIITIDEGDELSGTVNGSTFRAQNATPPGTKQAAIIQLSGNLPSDTATTWTGTLNIDPNMPACAGNQVYAVTATRMADLTKTYTGTASLYHYAPSGGQPISTDAITITAVFQQGIAQSSGGINPIALGGTIEIKGSPCFTSGSIESFQSDYPQSNVAGTEFVGDAAMNDGAYFDFGGLTVDAAASGIYLFGNGSGGSCGNTTLSDVVLKAQ
jgi:hypothetical protein